MNDDTILATRLARQLSDLLNVKVNFIEVLDELLLIRAGYEPINKMLSEHIKIAIQ